MDNTTFGNDIPTLPQWAGPPRTIVQVQAILYASLVISLFAAFLAMVGKQWLDQYASVDTRGSTIERCRNRQRKFDGTITWRFDYVMESLPLMLQGALFLLGCALSIYLWGIDRTIASVILGVTSLGVIFYGFVVIVGTASVNCPYQTPHARVLRYIIRHALPLVLRVVRLVASSITKGSESIAVLARSLKRYGRPMYIIVFPVYFLVLPALLVYDMGLLALAILKGSSYLALRTHIWFRGPRKPVREQGVLDIQCISWILRASMDKAVHLSALKLLATITAQADFSPTLISTCFDILISCVVLVDDKAVVPPESEELAKESARCCLGTLFHANQTLGTIKRARNRYTKVFKSTTNFDALDPNHSLRTIHSVFYSSHPETQLNDRELLYKNLAHTLANLANENASEPPQHVFDALLQLRGLAKVSRWSLRFALNCLAQDPPPPSPIIINCLSIIAIDLGCSIPLNAMIQNERYSHT